MEAYNFCFVHEFLWELLFGFSADNITGNLTEGEESGV